MMCYFTRRWTVAMAAVGAALLTAQVASAQLDYSSDLGAEFKATFPSGDPSMFPPSSPIFGDWRCGDRTGRPRA